MANNLVTSRGTVPVASAQQQAMTLAKTKKQITDRVLARIGEMEKEGGITIPKGYAAGNQINLAMLQLMDMKGKGGGPILEEVEQASVCNALLRMCIKGLSLEKKQFAFIQYGSKLQMQEEYHGNILLAKRLGGAGDPQAQVIYEGDVFEYRINPKTGKKEIVRHEQSLANIDNNKIIGAWCLIPYRNNPELEPKVEVMTIAEIRTAWMQNAQSKGQSPAHQKFTQEMAKKTVINRACKLFYSTSDDAGLYDDSDYQEPDLQEQPEEATKANVVEAVFTEQEPAVEPKTQVVDEPKEPQPEPDPMPEGFYDIPEAGGVFDMPEGEEF